MENCNVWLEKFIKINAPVRPADVYAAADKVGFTRREVKKARRWHGKYIDTQVQGSETFWRWSP